MRECPASEERYAHVHVEGGGQAGPGSRNNCARKAVACARKAVACARKAVACARRAVACARNAVAVRTQGGRSAASFPRSDLPPPRSVGRPAVRQAAGV